jgi:hypothetical protein
MSAPAKDPYPFYLGASAPHRWVESVGGIAFIVALIGIGRWVQKMEDRQAHPEHGAVVGGGRTPGYDPPATPPASNGASTEPVMPEAGGEGSPSDTDPPDGTSTGVDTTPGAIACDRIGLHITSPVGAAPVKATEIASGDVSGLPPGAHVWLLARRSDLAPLWWPQREVQGPKWSAEVAFGMRRDAGFEFDLAAVVLDAKEQVRIENYWTNATNTGDWKPISVNYVCETTLKVRRK